MVMDAPVAEKNESQQRLLKTLESEVGYYQSLLDLTRAEHRALLEGDVAVVEELLGKKGHLARQLTRIASEREATAASVALDAGLPANASLRDLAVAFAPVAREKLAAVEGRLRDDLSELSELNQRNAAMLRSSLDLLGRWMGLFVQPADSPAATYAEDGKRTQRKRPRVLDRKA